MNVLGFCIFCLFFFYVFVSLPSFNLYDVLKFKTHQACVLQKPYNSQIWCLWTDLSSEENKRIPCVWGLQKAPTNRCIREKVWVWPTSSCFMRRFCTHTNSFIEIHADFCRCSGKFLPSFDIFFHYLLQLECIPATCNVAM